MSLYAIEYESLVSGLKPTSNSFESSLNIGSILPSETLFKIDLILFCASKTCDWEASTFLLKLGFQTAGLASSY